MDFCSIASGSSGNCIYVGSDHSGVLVDAGISGKKITEGLHGIDRKPEELDGILITHEHSDHIKGLGVLSRKYGLPIYGTHGTIEAIRDCSGLGKIDGSLYHEIEADHPFTVGDLDISPFSISHDAAEPVAYRLQNNGKAVAVATDMGCYSDYTVSYLKGLDGILLEANHDINMLQVGAYPYPLKQRILGRFGHLSNDHAGRLLCQILHDNLKAIILGHLSKENNYEALAYATVCAEITMGENPYRADDFPIQVAKRDQALPLIAL